ncbi:YaaR family protein [Bacillus sp. CGMCC 1.16541]|uniref:YaaR family protein n=1 Tax=Bacillus sp. CGMCC 1.16541 TaxID=2185143 RepID=UPI000D72C40C|nr:YaaR family protein [Bacillus sp. CGMCC 1.16541]
MEIQRLQQASLQKMKASDKGVTASTTFTEVMRQKKQDITYERLHKLMEQIERQGEVLAKHRSIDGLRHYKKLVKQFMDDVVKNGLDLDQQRGFNNRGSYTTYHTVREVDHRLHELTEAVLHKERGQLDLLQTIGEIQGLLVNMYV